MSYVGKLVTKVKLVRFVFENEVHKDDCQLQLYIDHEAIIRLASGSDGQSLVVHKHSWTDPFDGKLDEANALYVHAHGKWSLFDVSNDRPFSDIVGQQIRDVLVVLDTDRNERGVFLHIGNVVMWYIVDSDEGCVLWGPEPALLGKLGLHTSRDALPQCLQ